jgi:dTDP-4-amino-4,6-dideoxygalactose transaminase
MSDDLIRYIRPVLPSTREWTPYLEESYAVGYFANFGPTVRHFEQRLKKEYARGRAAVTAPNATNGLVVALQALGIRGKVLIPSYTFPATAHAVLMAECTPVFCDISEDTWELDPRAVAKALQDPDICAVMHVRAYGFGHDLSWLEALATKRGVPLIIDSAAAIGGTASTRGFVGQQGDVEVFSFHATKVFGIGEGATLFVDQKHEEAVRRASNFGILYPDVTGPGQNSKMSDFQAAVGLALLDRIDGYIQRRREVVERYHHVLSGLEWITQAPKPELSPWQSYPVRLGSGKDAQRILETALKKGLELKRGYYRPLHRTTYFSRFAHGGMPVTDAIGETVVCLPVYSDMPLELAGKVLELFMASAR